MNKPQHDEPEDLPDDSLAEVFGEQPKTVTIDLSTLPVTVGVDPAGGPDQTSITTVNQYGHFEVEVWNQAYAPGTPMVTTWMGQDVRSGAIDQSFPSATLTQDTTGQKLIVKGPIEAEVKGLAARVRDAMKMASFSERYGSKPSFFHTGGVVNPSQIKGRTADVLIIDDILTPTKLSEIKDAWKDFALNFKDLETKTSLFAQMYNGGKTKVQEAKFRELMMQHPVPPQKPMLILAGRQDHARNFIKDNTDPRDPVPRRDIIITDDARRLSGLAVYNYHIHILPSFELIKKAQEILEVLHSRTLPYQKGKPTSITTKLSKDGETLPYLTAVHEVVNLTYLYSEELAKNTENGDRLELTVETEDDITVHQLMAVFRTGDLTVAYRLAQDRTEKEKLPEDIVDLTKDLEQ